MSVVCLSSSQNHEGNFLSTPLLMFKLLLSGSEVSCWCLFHGTYSLLCVAFSFVANRCAMVFRRKIPAPGTGVRLHFGPIGRGEPVVFVPRLRRLYSEDFLRTTPTTRPADVRATPCIAVLSEERPRERVWLSMCGGQRIRTAHAAHHFLSLVSLWLCYG